jgi:hypothetical protein
MPKSPVARSKPRNPLVAAAKFRRAGQHRSEPGSLRQAEHRRLQREIAGLDGS